MTLQSKHEPESQKSAPSGDTVVGDQQVVAKGGMPFDLPATAAFEVNQSLSPFMDGPPTADIADSSPRPSLSPVGQYFHKFELLDMRGGGGMGVVFKARDTKLNRIVALKTLRNTILPESDELERFHREAKAISQLAHPFIVPLLEYGEFRGTPYYVMQLAEGGSLSSWRKHAPRPPAEVVAVVQKIALAVGYAHSQGIIHRDIKPGNILLTATAEPMLADFGLARMDDSSRQLTPTDFLVGTPTYMSPEQLRGSQVDGRADIWSLGVMLFELLNGKPPFDDPDRAALFTKITLASPPKLSTPQRPVDRSLERIVLRCLEKLPEERYQTAEALAADLAAWQRGELPSRTWRDWAAGFSRRARRHPVRVALSVAVPLALLFGTYWGVSYLDDQRAIRPLQQTLRRGETVTLVPLKGGPVWHRVFPEGAAHVSGSATTRITAPSQALIELLPGPMPSHFRLEVEARPSMFLSNDVEPRFLSFGCFVGGTPLMTDAWDQFACQAITLTGEPLSPQAGQVGLPSQALVQAATVSVGRDGKTHWFEFPFRGLQQVPESQEGQLGAPWHRLEIEVAPTGISASFDGKPFAPLALPEMVKTMSIRNTQVKHGEPPFPLDINLTGSTGLIVGNGIVEFRNVRVTPLVPSP